MGVPPVAGLAPYPTPGISLDVVWEIVSVELGEVALQVEGFCEDWERAADNRHLERTALRLLRAAAQAPVG